MIRGKKIWGRKRHVLVDTQGHLLAVKVLAADPSDQEGAKRLLEPVANKFPSIQVMWGDSHYGGELIDWVKEHLGWTVQTVKRPKVPKRGLLVPIGEEIDWDRLFPSGFTVLPKRWVIERTFAWITRVRRLARDHEGLPRSSEAFITLAMSRLMLTRLAPQIL
jgi:putative transposase